MNAAEIKKCSGRLEEYLKHFGSCFGSVASRDHLETYVNGQLGPLQRKSIEPIAIRAHVKPRTLQQFISCHKWDEASMRTTVRSIVSAEHADSNAIAVIDETSFDKKGKCTVGVKRQWCGHTGKVDNCVQTVHVTYVAKDFATIVDSDLYLPKEWIQDEKLRDEARIPADVQFRKKWEISLELLSRTINDGVQIRWVTADEYYGRGSEFLSGLEALGLRYVVEVPISTCGWTRAACARAEDHRRVDRLFERGGPSWVDYHVKDTTKGPLVWRARATRFVLHSGTDRSEKWLIIAENPLEGGVKYFLSNAPEDARLEDILSVAFSRWRVEKNFEESKQEIGLDHFEMRSYLGLQRHLAISMVSLLFLVKLSQDLQKQTTDHWTVPQTRLIVNTLVDEELLPEQRKIQLEHNLEKIEYWQKRAKVAAASHRKRRLRQLEEAGIDLEHCVKCPPWPSAQDYISQKVAL